MERGAYIYICVNEPLRPVKWREYMERGRNSLRIYPCIYGEYVYIETSIYIYIYMERGAYIHVSTGY